MILLHSNAFLDCSSNLLCSNIASTLDVIDEIFDRSSSANLEVLNLSLYTTIAIAIAIPISMNTAIQLGISKANSDHRTQLMNLYFAIFVLLFL